MVSPPKISVVCPVFRNASTLGELADRVALTTTERHELLLVVDGCPARSAPEAERVAQTRPEVGYLEFPENHGQSVAVVAGLARARAPVCVVMDADLQDPPEAIPALVGALRGNHQAVFGARRGRYQHIGRMTTSRLFKVLLRMVAGVPADAGAFVAITSQVADAVVAGGHPGRQTVPALVCRATNSVVTVPVVRDFRLEGRSAYSPQLRLEVAVVTLGMALGRRLGLTAAAGPLPTPVRWSPPRR